MTQVPDQKKPSFEECLAELEQIVAKIESGEIGLEESISRYEKGIKLLQQCRTILDAAEKKIQLLARGEGEQLAVNGETALEEE